MERKVGFGREDEEKTKDVLSKYIGKYIILYTQNNGNFSGMLNSIEENFAILNPFAGGTWDKEKGLMRTLLHNNSIVNIHSLIAIEPTTKKDIENYIEYQKNMAGKESKQT